MKKYYKVIYDSGEVKIIVSMTGWCKVHLKSQGVWKTDTFDRDYPIHLENDYSEISKNEYRRIVEETPILN